MSKIYRKTELPVIIPLGGVSIQSEPPQPSVPDHPSSIVNATQTEFVEDSDGEAEIDLYHRMTDHNKDQPRNRMSKFGDTRASFGEKFEKWLNEYQPPGGWTPGMSRASEYFNTHDKAPCKNTIRKWGADLIAAHKQRYARKA